MSDDDPDREAILARRRKLIAVALAGLTSAAGCGDDGGIGPQPCLEMAPVPEQTTLTPIDPPKEGETETVVAEEEGGGANEGEEAGAGDEGDEAGGPETPPQVCLRVRPPPPPQRPSPRPCLSVLRPQQDPPPATPQPCLDFAVPPDDDQAAPQPRVCLTPRIDREREEG